MKTTQKPQQRKKPSTSTNKQTTPPQSKQRYRVAPRRNRLWFWGAGGLILVLLIIIVATVVMRSQASGTDSMGGIAGVVTFQNLTRNHVSSKVAYPQVPPVGGDHNPVWLNCGMYSQPVINENAVHSMEHGAVWITYQPSLAQQDVDLLKSLVRGHTYALLSPYPGLPSPVVISAWGLQLQVKNASDPRLAQFLSRYEQGPQTPEPGAACSGGIGTPDAQ